MAGRARKSVSPHRARSWALSALLRHQRTEVLKISRTELSRRSGVSTSNIQAIEDGRTIEPGLFTVIALAVALNLDLGPMMRSVTGPVRATPLAPSGVAEQSRDQAAVNGASAPGAATSPEIGGR